MKQGRPKASDANAIKSTLYSGDSPFKNTHNDATHLQYVTSLIGSVFGGEITMARCVLRYVRALFVSCDPSPSTVSSNPTCGP